MTQTSETDGRGDIADPPRAGQPDHDDAFIVNPTLTLRELAAGVGCSQPTADFLLRRLKDLALQHHPYHRSGALVAVSPFSLLRRLAERVDQDPVERRPVVGDSTEAFSVVL
jgi:hypothetical protein